MLTKKQIGEVREHLDKAQNPIFFFDNDCDGLIAFILLRRYIEKGKGVAIKSFPELDLGYFRKIHELKADYVFVLDKPQISKGFIEEVKKVNLPIVWIDHHQLNDNEYPPERSDEFDYYNPLLNKPASNEPVSYLCYKITNKKEDMWLAMVGCISDNFFPDFAEEFIEKYPELWRKGKEIKDPSEAYYETNIGRISQILNFALKDRTTNVVSMLNFLFKVKSPQDILKENRSNYKIHLRYRQVNKFYSKMLEKAKKIARKSGRFAYFQYGGELSLSSDIANELAYLFPNKIIMVAYIKGAKANLSIRGKNIRELTLEAIKGIESATGGGHENATGAKVGVEDLEQFKKNFMKAVKR